MSDFDEAEYRHRFAAWCASTAIISSQIGCRIEAGFNG